MGFVSWACVALGRDFAWVFVSMDDFVEVLNAVFPLGVSIFFQGSGRGDGFSLRFDLKSRESCFCMMV